MELFYSLIIVFIVSIEVGYVLYDTLTYIKEVDDEDNNT